MGSHVAVMSRGRIEQVGSPQEVYARPASVFVAQFIGTPPMNVLPPGTVEPTEWLVGVRPEHVVVDPDGDVDATVTLVEHLGHEALVHLLVGEAAVVSRVDAAASLPATGDAVRLAMPPAHRHRFDPSTTRRVDP